MGAVIIPFPVRLRRPLPAHGDLVRRVLQRTQARREARSPGGAG